MKIPMKILGCGGRKYANYARVREVLNIIQPTHIVHGAATGADTLVGRYAKENSIQCNAYPAQWKRKDPRTGRIYIDKGAGFQRNKEMLLTSKPDLVIALPGGNGTKHMVKFAQENGYPVITIPDAGPLPSLPTPELPDTQSSGKAGETEVSATWR